MINLTHDGELLIPNNDGIDPSIIAADKAKREMLSGVEALAQAMVAMGVTAEEAVRASTAMFEGV